MINLGKDQDTINGFPRHENLGRYEAEVGSVKAELGLTAELRFIATRDPGTDWYHADVTFSTDQFSVSAKYHSNVLKDIFNRLIEAEEGIESLLLPNIPLHDWQYSKEVLKCIFSLEEQASHLYEERREAEKQRTIKVYGTANPR